MTAAKSRKLISEAEYLRGEELSPVKHEYIAGIVYAMAGASNNHNLIATNCLALLHPQLRSGPCRVLNSDTKVRLRPLGAARYYYPDVQVTCRPNPGRDHFQDEPVVIIEILSPDTQRIDGGEKRDAYFTIPSLQDYILLEQDAAVAEVYRRAAAGFDREVIEGMDAVIDLTSITARLPLAEVYANVEFTPADGKLAT